MVGASTAGGTGSNGKCHPSSSDASLAVSVGHWVTGWGVGGSVGPSVTGRGVGRLVGSGVGRLVV